jgi:sarcosine oxidase
MRPHTSDVIVVGAGAMGSAAAMHCAARGLRVVALERHAVGHAFGSSHGLTRIIRLAYFEDPSYVPLLRRAFALWRALEEDLPAPLLHVTGGLDVGPAGSRVFEGALASCREYALPHEVLDASALAARFPGWRPDEAMQAVHQPDAGFLESERCIAAQVARARALGAEVREHVRVTSWQVADGVVRVVTDGGSFEAPRLVLAAGAWMPSLAPSLAPRLAVERQVLGWFDIEPASATHFAPAAFPVFIVEQEGAQYYGFPQHGVPGFKIGRYHHLGERVDPDTVDRTVHPYDEAALRDAVSRWFPAANGPLLRSATCLFTNTADEHFIIDVHPAHPEVLLLSPCSGHGFKFASVIGEIAADLVASGTTAHDIGRFRLASRAAPVAPSP